MSKLIAPNTKGVWTNHDHDVETWSQRNSLLAYQRPKLPFQPVAPHRTLEGSMSPQSDARTRRASEKCSDGEERSVRPSSSTIDRAKRLGLLELKWKELNDKWAGNNLGWDELPASFLSTTVQGPAPSSGAHSSEKPVDARAFPVRDISKVFFHGTSLYESGRAKIKEKSLEAHGESCYNHRCVVGSGFHLPCAKRVETVQNSSFDWPGAREVLKTRLGVEVVSRWLDPLSVATVNDHIVVLQAPNPFFRDWVASHYLEALRSCSGGRELQVVTATDPGGSPSGVRQTATSLPFQPQPAWAHGLNGRFTFDRFVVGPSNRFAHAASMAVAESPAKAYNPLFIYGGVGLGKTHLMQAIGHAVLQRWPNRRVVYISSEGFTNDLIAAIQTRTTSRFRDRYRTVDVLLVDDIHFIAEKEATQEEFFHTFNALYDAHKQIVMSSDRSPKEIAGLEERLVSRFEWGLVTDIQAPDLETRIAILRKKAVEAGIDVPDAVTTFIGQQVTANIRELEGALIRVMAYCNLFNKPLTPAVAQEVLKDMVREVSARVTLEEIQRRVAGYFQIELAVLRGSRRQRSVLYPRQLAMFLCRRLTDASLPEIGQAFGGRDHTTVMHAVEKIEREVTQDIHKKQLIEHLNQLVTTASLDSK